MELWNISLTDWQTSGSTELVLWFTQGQYVVVIVTST